MRLYRDDEDDPGVEPTTASLRQALVALDGDACTLVSLQAHEAVLMCGGDAACGLVVTLQSQERIAVLIGDEARAGDRVTLVAGGQPGEYPGDKVVDLPTASQAMETFRQTAELDARLTWRME